MKQSENALEELSAADLSALEAELSREFAYAAANKMSLDLSRGKPAADQLDLSNGLEDAIAGDFKTADGTDVRNYGGLRGIPEARALGGELMSMPAANVMAAGNSSLSLMHLVLSTALTPGLWGDARAWGNTTTPKVLTPVPGYDRHFVLSDALGLEMLNVHMTESGPDMEQARALAAADPDIKGIWCVPKYSNPTGCVYSESTVEAMARLPLDAAADDFVVLWDNAYAVHDLEFPGVPLAALFTAAEAEGTGDHMVQFASTSKITFAGAGISFLGASDRVLATLESQLQFMTVGHDKLNQLRHTRFLANRLEDHMRAHAALLKPKFDLVEQTLATELGTLGIASWTQPKGGYFVSLDVLPGLATQIVELAHEVGLTLTPAGATYPHGDDPDDRNVRIAPTFAAIADLTVAMQILTLCVKLASVRQLISARG